MPRWMLSVICVLLTIVLAVVLVYYTGAFRPEPVAILGFLVLIALLVTTLTTPLVAWIGSRLGQDSYRGQPATAWRIGFWIGVWASVCIGLQIFGLFSIALALAAAVILVMVEAFLRQMSHQHRAR